MKLIELNLSTKLELEAVLCILITRLMRVFKEAQEIIDEIMVMSE